MEEKCPICFKQFPIPFLERHVNSCLDTLELLLLPVPATVSGLAEGESDESTMKEPKQLDAFAALGLKTDSWRNSDKAVKKEKATLTGILIAERRLKRKQEELEREIKRQSLEKSSLLDESSQLAGSLGQARETGVCDAHGSTQVAGSVENDHTDILGKLDSQVGVLRNRQRDRNDELAKLTREAELPLAQRLRPKTLDDFFGQEKLVGENGVLRNIMSAEQIPSFILWGVPGVGKTSLARIIATSSNYKFVELSGADSNAKKLKEAFADAQSERQLTGQRTILFLDEIHRFNRAVQDLLLPVIEKGTVTVIGATTENPSFTLNNALLSRMHTFVMEPLSNEALVKILNRGLFLINKTRKLVYKLHLIALSRDAINHIARVSTGDSRVALNILESINAYLSGMIYKVVKKEEPEIETIDFDPKFGVIKVGIEELKPLMRSQNFHQMYDKVGENHYDTISAFHKSVRGSNADAAVFYLVRMLSGGEDPLFIARRMIVIASEDIGLRDSSCLPFAISVMEAIQFIGMPEGEIILAHCAVKLSRAPKSTKSYRALRGAQALLKENPDVMKLPIPLHLRNAPTALMKDLGYGNTYKYNPHYKHGKVIQEYLPPELNETKFVENGHFKDGTDRLVSTEEMKALDEERQAFEEFKRSKREERSTLAKNSRKQSREKTRTLIELVEDSAERLNSYDEFLDQSDQPEYFDGDERDHYSDDPDASHNFECSYDEFVNEKSFEQRDSPIHYDEMTI